MTNVYTIDEVARHSNVKDLWVVIHDVVYDITEFYTEHPGGEEVLLKLAGTDATDCFESIGHSYEAINLRNKYKIGELDGAKSTKITNESKTKTEVKEPMEDNRQYQQEPKTEVSLWSWIFMGAIFAIYVAIIYYWFKKFTS